MSELSEILKLSANGKIERPGESKRTYLFHFGWLSRLELESLYGGTFDKFLEETDEAMLIANLLLAGLKAVPANNIPEKVDKRTLYGYMEDLGEKNVAEIYKVGMHALGFTQRIFGLSPEDVKKLADLAASQSQPTGQDS